MDHPVSQQTMFVSCIIACSLLLVSTGAEYAATEGGQLQNPSKYGEVYAIDFENGQYQRSNEVGGDGTRDFLKIPENGLLIIRLLPKSVLEKTVLKDVINENGEIGERSKRSPGGGGGCNTCGGGGGGHRPGGGSGRGGGGGSAGAWSNSSSGAWGKGYGKGRK